MSSQIDKRKLLPTSDRQVKNTAASSIKSFQLRLLLIWLLLFLGASGLAARLYYLQIIDPPIEGKNLKERAKAQQMAKLYPYMPRRQIVDRHQNVLATDRILYELYAHPSMFTINSEKVKPEKVAGFLASILQRQTYSELIELFRQRDTGIRIAKNLSESVKEKITNQRIDGLELVQYYSRFYPHGDMVAEVLGYVNLDRKPLPQAGVEYTQQKLLERPISSLSLKRSFIKDQSIYYPGETNSNPKLLQSDNLRLQLTLDLKIQQAVRAALKQQMTEYDAKRGAVIVMDVRDGSIVALVTEPTYDPNQYFKYKNLEVFKNWAITDLYEPGSTFKPINVAIALDAGVITPSNVFEDKGQIEIDGWEIRNHDTDKVGGRGILTIPEILQYSSNVGMIKIIERMERQDYYRQLKELGLGDKLDFDIPGYTPGQLKGEIEFSVKSIEAATAAFGQGLSLTPLKLIQLHGAIANGGKLVTPHVVRGLSDYEGYLHWEPSYPDRQVFSPQTSQAVLEMMESVVEEGSGSVASIPGYRIAGKTGTAQKATSVGEGGYHESAKITSFVGIFPVEKPRYAVLAVVDEPIGEYTFGSTVAAPIVKTVIESIIAIEGIPPSRPEELKKVSN